MNYQALIGKMTEYLHQCTLGLSKWLKRRLPDVHGENWWSIGVIDKLTTNQQDIVIKSNIRSLSGLDLSTLLRVADKNWYYISQRYFLTYTERDRLKSMFAIRNRWAHIASESIESSHISADLELLHDFCDQLGMDKVLLCDIKRFIYEFKTNNKSETLGLISKTSFQEYESTQQGTDITVGSIVRLKSNIKKTGVVMSEAAMGDTVRFDVFMDGVIEVFYADQLEIFIPLMGTGSATIKDLLKTLTAQQIVKPSYEHLYSLNSARIDFVPYQFRPALKLLKSATPRLLIADSVGVGKTIEAGLIYKELQARSSIDTVIIICPKPLVAERKWEIEMREKFGEEFVPANNSLLRQIIFDYESSGNWDERYKRLIIPYSILTEELINGSQGKKYHPGISKLDPPPIFDLLIVDEAHHVRNNHTQAHKAVRFFCEHSSAVLFLTATPIQLGNQDLFNLLTLLFPDTVIDKASFEAMAQPNSYINKTAQYLRAGPNFESKAIDEIKKVTTTEWGRNVIAPNPIYSNAVLTINNGNLTREQRVKLINDVESLHSFSHMINRTRRQDIGDFCVRRPYTITSDFTEQQLELYEELLGFEYEALCALHPNVSTKFLMSTINRQAASSLFGIAPFIKDLVAKRLSELFDESDIDLDDIDIDFGPFIAKAKRLISLAENLPDTDPKFDTLASILKERAAPGGGKTIVFSTFRHTLNYLYARIKKELHLRVELVNGSVPDDVRFELRQRFALPENDPNAIDVLLFTEVGSEGLDYQFCNALVNYDLPWNPMRIEQRIGRIDRRGQLSPTVHIYNCIVSGTIDAEIYERCFLRIGVFEQSLGECSEILGHIESSIMNIVFDSALTAEERALKIEYMADNEIRLIVENRRLEDESKEMFGLDITGFTDDLMRAENPWLIPHYLQNLIEGYLNKTLGMDKQYISEGKLTLSANEKQLLLEDYRGLEDRTPDIIWTAYLNSGKGSFNITFSQDEAKINRKCLFITPTHPLIRQAARTYARIRDLRVKFSVCSDTVPAGDYAFMLYSWEYQGARTRTELVAVCNDLNVSAELLELLRSAVSLRIDTRSFPQDWDHLEERHLNMWQQEKARFLAEVHNSCLYKIESLKKSLAARKLVAERQLEATGDPRIERMRRSEIERLDHDLLYKKERLERETENADLLATRIAFGIMTITRSIEYDRD